MLTEADLTGADLSGASFGQARLSRVRGHEANLSRARFGKAVFAGNHFDGANFNLANFTDFSDSASRLPGATFHGASIGDSKLSGTVLSGADLHGATLELVTTQNLQADGISLRNGYVIGSTLRGGTMRGSDFGGTRVLAKPQHGDLDHAISIQTDFIDVDLSQASFGNTDVAATTLFQRSTIAHVRTAGSTILTSPALRDQFFDYTHARIASTDGCALLEGGEHVICEGHNVSTNATPPFQHNGRFTWRSVAPEGHRDMGIWGGEHKLTGKASHDFKTFKVEVTPNFEHVTGTGDGGQPGEAGGPLALDLKRWQQPDGNLGYELAFHGWLLRKQAPAVRWLG